MVLQKNVLVDDDGTARISKYGLGPLLREEGSLNVEPAHEVLERGATTKEGDIFWFGMVTVEVCT